MGETDIKHINTHALTNYILSLVLCRESAVCSLRGAGCGPHPDWVVVERPVSEDVQPSFLHYNLSLPGLVPGEVVFAGTPGRRHAEENLVKGRMDSLQQSFRSPAGPPVPNGWVPSGGGG